jgi:ribose-phosphate pyrophosphokinase
MNVMRAIMTVDPDKFALFALNASRTFGEKIAVRYGLPLSPHEEREFEDGEHKARPLVNVRGKDVFVIQSLFGDEKQSVNDKLCRLLFFIGALRDASAQSVTVVVPYLCYARKDRKSKARDPITSRYVAAIFEAVGASRVVTLDVHNIAAFQNAFRCPTEHLEAKTLFVDFFARLPTEEPIVVLSPDVGGIKRAEEFRRALAEAVGQTVTAGFMEKRRSWGVVTGETLFGEVAGRTAIIMDDLISTGTTVLRAAQAARTKGANKVFAAATHGLFTANANHVLADSSLERVIITDTIPPFRLEEALVKSKLVVLDTSLLFAEAIRRMHEGGSIVELSRTEG